jgi:hypothetical protein
MRRIRCAVIPVMVLLTSPGSAGEAICKDYLQATGEDRARFNGFIYGYVMSRMENRGDTAINAAVSKVRDLTTRYCLEKPNERVSSVIATWATVVSRVK